MAGDTYSPRGRAWAEPLHAAVLRPAAAASAWRAGTGGRVVGVLGWSVPRELVVAAGMLPVRLSPRRLSSGLPAHGGAPEPAGAPGPGDIAAGLGRELPPAAARIAEGLLSGALDWVDAVLIGRDNEAHTKLFYLLRELRRSGAAAGLPPIAFFDLLRLPSRTSARYNRLRARELIDTLARWAGRPVSSDDLGRAADDAAATALRLAALTALRTAPLPAVAGGDALAAALAAQVLPGEQLRAHLAAVGPGSTGPSVPARVFLAGSGLDDPAAYDALEDLGIALVGEDHEWGDDGSAPPARTTDPLDGIVDRYHFGHGGVARDGLRDRAERTAGKVRAAAADGVLYLTGEHDEAAGWQLPALAERLGPDIPVVQVKVADAPEDSRPPLRDAALRLRTEVRRA
jgi:benzoyl-CoA reductase/2-hydroxyglutaryl-CoA dehydratase subunit BcrC/BadD/HgdB